MTDSPLQRYLPLIDEPELFWDSVSKPLPTCIWANPLKTNPEALAAYLASVGIDLEPVAWYPGAFRARGWEKPGDTLPFIAGWYYVQEEIAMTAVQVLDPQPGDRVLDLCAAPGSKTAQLSLRVTESGMVVANEIKVPRLASLRTAIARLGLLNVVTTNSDGRTMPLPPHSFDRVLVDVPCSGEGTVRKHLNQTRRSPQLPNLNRRMAGFQKQLLDRALQLVKPGGIVVYSTCTFAPEENEAVLDQVLGDRGYLESADIPGLTAIPGLLQWENQSFRSDLVHARRYFPHFNDTGGFFVARIRRTEAQLEAQLSEPSELSSPHQTATLVNDPQPLDWFCQRFGIPPATLEPFQLWRKGKDKLWIAARNCYPPEQLLTQTIGIPLVRQMQNDVKPTTFALQRFGASVRHNVIELTEPESVQQFLCGKTFSLVATPLTATVDPGYVHVRHGPFELGCGFYRPGELQSQLPKVLWRT